MRLSNHYSIQYPVPYTSTMGIWERLGNVIKSYLNDEGNETFGSSAFDGNSSGRRARDGSVPFGQGDPDLDAAYEELDDFLNGAESRKEGGEKARGERLRQAPAELREDFAELGLTPEASAEECKEAYKKILKVYHPDRHTQNPEEMKKATEKTTRVNAAYDRLQKWFRDRDAAK